MQATVKGITVILLDTVANAVLPSDIILARVRLIKKVLPVLSGASKNITPV